MLNNPQDRIRRHEAPKADTRVHEARTATPSMRISPPSEPPPPPYEPPTPGRALARMEAPQSIVITAPTSATQPQDDKYSFLGVFDTILVIDDSGSMTGLQWRIARNALATITPVCTAHDADGVDIHFFNHPGSYTNITSAAAVDDIFNSVAPGGSTPTGQCLHKILQQYLRVYEDNPKTKPINLICITDGSPSDDVESPLIACAKKLDKLDAPAWQVGVQFFQIGSDEGARKHLKGLDDDLQDIAGDHEMRDMVDTVPFTDGGGALTGEGILKVVLGAVNRRLDRSKKGLHL